MEYDWPGNVRELQAVIRQSVLNTMGTVIVEDFLPLEVKSGGSYRAEDSPVPMTSSQSDQKQIGRTGSSDLADFVRSRLSAGSVDLYAETLAMMERYLITSVLQETMGNQSKAAEILGITRGKIRDRIAAFGISVDKSVSVDEP